MGAVEQDAFHAKYSLGPKLGEGTFGQVRLAKLRARQRGEGRGEHRAVKIIDVRGFGENSDEQKLKDARNEAAAMERVGVHGNCVRLMEFFESQSLFYIVMEKCDGSLTERLEESRLDEVDVARLFREMLLGIEHVHEVKLVHRDIKPSNYLFSGGSKGNLGTVKLADFGMAATRPRNKPLTGNCGSAPYMSPEMVSGKSYWQKTDVWSFGVTAYVLLYGDFPYMPNEMNSKAMKQKIKEGTPEPTFAPDPMSDIPIPSQSATDFLRAVLQRSPERRCTSLEALCLPFLSKVAASGLLIGQSQSAAKLVPEKRLQHANTQMLSFRTAVQRTQKVEAQLEEDEKHVDPTVAHSLDELLNLLQATPHRHFTEGHQLSDLLEDSPFDDGTGKHRQFSRSRTCNGAFSHLEPKPVFPAETTPVDTPPVATTQPSATSSKDSGRSSKASLSTDVPNSSRSFGAPGHEWLVGQEHHNSFPVMSLREVSPGNASAQTEPISKFNDKALTDALNFFMQTNKTKYKVQSEVSTSHLNKQRMAPKRIPI